MPQMLNDYCIVSLFLQSPENKFLEYKRLSNRKD